MKYAIAGLILVIVAMILLWPSPEKVDLEPYKIAIATADQEIKSLTAQNQALLNDIKQDSIQGAKESEAFKVKINRLSKRLADQRPAVDSIIIDNPVLIEYVNSADSVIEVQNWRIDALEHQVSKLQINLTGITKNFEQRIALHEQKYEAQEQLTIAAMKETRKEKRKRRLASVLVPVAAIAGFLLGSQ